MVPIAVNVPSGVNTPPSLLGAQVPLPNSNSSGPSPSSDETNSMQKDSMMDNEAEGVWSPDIEQSFHEALAIYPPCGRRKIILSDEGKMYGRNELIARYIKLRTGKTRTRKQVSSHIQVLARRKSREMQSQFKDQATKDKVLQSIASMSSAQIVSAGALTVLPNNRLDINQTLQPYKPAQIWTVGQTESDIKPFHQSGYMGLNSPQQANVIQSHAMPGSITMPASITSRPAITTAPSPFVNQNAAVSSMLVPPQFKGKQIASQKLRLVNFAAFREQSSNNESDSYSKHLFVHIDQSSPPYADHTLEKIQIHQIFDKFPDSGGGLRELFDKGPPDAFYLVKFWADLNVDLDEDPHAVYAVSGEYESIENITLEVSTKVCSFGKQVVEKIEFIQGTDYGRYEKNRFVYRICRSQMCEYMVNFIRRLKHLPERFMMNSVLENFTIQQVITNHETKETLLCIAFIFEVSTSEHGPQHHLYQLVAE